MKLFRTGKTFWFQQVVFPGEIAGASLKRERHPHVERQLLVVFPGEIAGASLKQLVHAPDVAHRSTVFSPAKSPGPH